MVTHKVVWGVPTDQYCFNIIIILCKLHFIQPHYNYKSIKEEIGYDK